MEDFNVIVTKNGAPDDAIQVVYVYEGFLTFSKTHFRSSIFYR